jgi:hypothetical protein
MISRATLDKMLLLNHMANTGDTGAEHELTLCLLEECEGLIDAAIGYVAMQEQSAALYPPADGGEEG